MSSRKAADPGMIERIASFLSDNALTRSWSDSVGGAVNWAERQVLSDDELRQVIANAAARSQSGEQISDETLALLQRIKGAPIDRAAVDAVMAQHQAGPADYVGGAAQVYAKQADLQRDRLKQLAAELQGPQNQRTEAGTWASTILGHPVAAYSAVSAGGALATAGGIEAYDWWKAQQEQAQKDRQLPLQGGVEAGMM